MSRSLRLRARLWHSSLALVTLTAPIAGAVALSATPSPGARGTSTAAIDEASDSITVARLRYEGGGDWYANPSSLPNLLREIRTRTGIAVAGREVAVSLTDPSLPDYPWLYMTGHGTVRLSPRERLALREYLLGGGFLHADDNYGLDESLRRELAAVFPERPLVEIPASHPVFHQLYDFAEGLPKIHEHDGKPPQALGIFDEGRLLVFYSYESDLGDGWEDADVHQDPAQTREAALQMGVNLFLYALGGAGGGQP